MERPCIYSECLSSLTVARDLFPLVGMFLHIISHRFSSGLVKRSLFGIILLLYWGMIDLSSFIAFLLSFMIGLDWMNRVPFRGYSIFCYWKDSG